MNYSKVFSRYVIIWAGVISILCIIAAAQVFGADVPEIKERGVLRHLGVPYANFVTGARDGMDVELVQLFAQSLGVKYEYVKTSWGEVIGDLTGKTVKAKGDEIEIIGDVPVKGDIIANGFTIIPWRQKIVNFSTPIFPTQVWLVARADSPIRPIKSTGDIDKDIAAVRALLRDHSVLGVVNTCLDPSLYDLEAVGAKVKLFTHSLNELAPAVINREAEVTLLDVPDALIALEKWPGKIKVIGPISRMQSMGCGFAKSSPQLNDAFNQFLKQCKQDGTYIRLVKKYYPAVFRYYPDFFQGK